jgi:hypothetical protein
MPADPLYPAEIGPEPRPEGQFRADLVRYLDDLPTSELGSLLSELPRTRTDVLIVELNERLPDAGKLLSPAGTPGPGEGRRSLGGAGRRAARNQPQAGPADVVIGTAGERASRRRGRLTRPPDGGCETRCARSVRRQTTKSVTGKSWSAGPCPVTTRAARLTSSGRVDRARRNGATATVAAATLAGRNARTAATAEHPCPAAGPDADIGACVLLRRLST